MALEEKLKQITNNLDQLAGDNTVPRNIRRGAEEVKKILLNNEEALDVRTASANSKLDELADDPNIPLHARTLIWNIMSQVEGINA